MEKKKEKIESKLKVNDDHEMKAQNDESEEDESEDEEDIPEFIDWRAKKSHK